MDDPVIPIEQRAWRRRTGSSLPCLSAIRLPAGESVSVLDISCGGAYVETTARLLPGMPVHIPVAGAEARSLIAARVLRSQVVAITSGRLIYRVALRFEEPLNLPLDPASNGVAATQSLAHLAAAGN
jgi:hypothetical protein